MAQGQSLQQIESDQPWFTKIFGPSTTVRGAQAMSATTALTQAETQTLEDMQDLKQQSPDALLLIHASLCGQHLARVLEAGHAIHGTLGNFVVKPFKERFQ